MKRIILLTAAIMLWTFGLWAQNASQQQRPTLGPEPAPNAPSLEPPSVMGPLNAKIMDPVKLRMVHSIYVDLMDNKLDLKLMQDLANSPFRVVSNKREADAVLQGSCFDSPHLKNVHSEVYLTGRNGKPIWQDVIHKPSSPRTVAKAVAGSADYTDLGPGHK
jgi:hypothetical protein